MLDPYSKLMEHLGFPGSELLRKILVFLMNEEEAEVAAALPGSVEEVAERTGKPAERVKEILDGLFFKGVAFPKDFKRREYFRFARDIIQLHDATLATKQLDPEKGRDYAALWKEFGEKEFYGKFGELINATGMKVWRVVPAYKAIKDLPGVLPCEDIREILKANSKIAVVPCSCRTVSRLTGEGCRYTDEEKTWHCIQVGRGAEYVVERGSGVELTLEEALKLIDEIEEDGLIHTWNNTAEMSGKGLTVNCNCCSDCCEFFLFSRAAKLPPEKSPLEKSRYQAFVDEEKCAGCQTCIERCHFDAIEMYRPEGSRKYKAKVIPENCFGCGVCVVGCPEGAIKLKAVRPPEHIPGAVSA
ncbi:MAG: 4Fe-4S dicluster-binding protein [Candidatus Freyarchaeota archaeon]|nr:4Fe-4S dicluster domain-containing protein [Candidatus Freyrarchaeum guaymaensis]